jgi:hypothetical protein
LVGIVEVSRREKVVEVMVEMEHSVLGVVAALMMEGEVREVLMEELVKVVVGAMIVEGVVVVVENKPVVEVK